MTHAVAPAVPAFLVVAERVRAEQHATRLQTRMQLPQYTRQLLAGHMKQCRVGEHAIETVTRQVELKEILLPYFAAAVGARHRGEVRGALQTNRDMTAFGKRLEVASGPAAEIQYCEGRFVLNESQQRRNVLADVVIARPLPENLGTPVVVFQREVGDFSRSC